MPNFVATFSTGSDGSFFVAVTPIGDDFNALATRKPDGDQDPVSVLQDMGYQLVHSPLIYSLGSTVRRTRYARVTVTPLT